MGHHKQETLLISIITWKGEFTTWEHSPETPPPGDITLGMALLVSPALR